MLRFGAVGVLALGLFNSGCGGVDCGSGTSEVDGECRPSLSCGQGTSLVNGECVGTIPPGGLTCGADTAILGEECVVADTACVSPASFDMASGRCVSPAEISCGAGTEIMGTVCVPSCDGLFEVQNLTLTGCDPAARVQVVNAVADPALPLVDVYVENQPLPEGDDLMFGQATPVFKVPLRGNLQILIDGGPTVVGGLFASELSVGERYLAVARGLRSTDGFDTSVNDDLGVDLEVVPGLREEFDIDDSDDDANFALYHAVTDAPAVGVGVQDEFDTVPAAPIYSDVAYGELSAYVALPEGDTAAVDVYAQSSGTRVASVQTSSGSALPVGVGLPEGSGVLVAMGFLNPAANTGSGSEPGAPLQVVAVLPDGTALPLDAAARVQLVHGAVDAPGSSVSVVFEREAGGAPGMEVGELAYQEALPFRATVAGTRVRVRLDNDGEEGAAVTLTPAFGATERWVIVSDPSSSLVILGVATVERERAESGVDVQVFHASADAGPVDVHFHQSLSPGVAELSNPVSTDLMFRSGSATLPDQPFQDYVVSLTEVGNTSTSIVDFNTGLNTAGLASSGDALAFIVTGSVAGGATNLDLVVVGADGQRGSPIGGQ